MAEKTVEAHITGRVQGVWFRGWTREQAVAKGLKGWVMNCADGSVKALFTGPEIDVNSMLALCRVGPRNARVDLMKTFSIETPQNLDGFRIRR